MPLSIDKRGSSKQVLNKVSSEFTLLMIAHGVCLKQEKSTPVCIFVWPCSQPVVNPSLLVCQCGNVTTNTRFKALLHCESQEIYLVLISLIKMTYYSL